MCTNIVHRMNKDKQLIISLKNCLNFNENVIFNRHACVMETPADFTYINTNNQFFQLDISLYLYVKPSLYLPMHKLAFFFCKSWQILHTILDVELTGCYTSDNQSASY